eukprot:Nitzschia sp. Nitz4//scaffold74_size92883//15730//17156//NITZ4_004814-RA/size92883-augustus-gene-0.3-mRNA-1//1//CDS//3329557568//4970//frame0
MLPSIILAFSLQSDLQGIIFISGGLRETTLPPWEDFALDQVGIDDDGEDDPVMEDESTFDMDSFPDDSLSSVNTEIRNLDTLPSLGNDQGEEEEVVPDEWFDSTFVKRNKQWIVLVDDEESIRLSVGDYLYEQGYEVSACADASAMMQLCTEPMPETGALPQPPDVIISDIRMPGEGGIQLIQRIRAHERLWRVPVILLTAKGMVSDRIEGYRAGADAYLSKPFDPDELVSIVDNLILRREQMSGPSSDLIDIQNYVQSIKGILQQNMLSVSKKTDVFLSDKERTVLDLVCKGYTDNEIAKDLQLRSARIPQIIRNIRDRTHTKSKTELVRWAISTGYVSVNQPFSRE